MKVLIMYRNTYEGGDGWTYHPLSIEISDYCQAPVEDEEKNPVPCGVKRGTSTPHSFCEDGEFYTVDTWKNACGHVDTYKDCYLEHTERQKKLQKQFQEQNK
jgi:hypothetical protein